MLCLSGFEGYCRWVPLMEDKIGKFDQLRLPILVKPKPLQTKAKA